MEKSVMECVISVRFCFLILILIQNQLANGEAFGCSFGSDGSGGADLSELFGGGGGGGSGNWSAGSGSSGGGGLTDGGNKNESLVNFYNYDDSGSKSIDWDYYYDCCGGIGDRGNGSGGSGWNGNGTGGLESFNGTVLGGSGGGGGGSISSGSSGRGGRGNRGNGGVAGGKKQVIRKGQRKVKQRKQWQPRFDSQAVRSSSGGRRISANGARIAGQKVRVVRRQQTGSGQRSGGSIRPGGGAGVVANQRQRRFNSASRQGTAKSSVGLKSVGISPRIQAQARGSSSSSTSSQPSRFRSSRFQTSAKTSAQSGKSPASNSQTRLNVGLRNALSPSATKQSTASSQTAVARNSQNKNRQTAG